MLSEIICQIKVSVKIFDNMANPVLKNAVLAVKEKRNSRAGSLGKNMKQLAHNGLRNGTI